MRELARALSGDQRARMAGRSAAVLAGAARSAADAHRRARGAAGHHAAAAAGGLRQHRQPDAGARQHAAARDRRPPGARRRPWRIVRLLLTENVLLALSAAAARRRASRSGAPRRCARCRSSARFRSGFRRSVDALGLAFAMPLGARLRRALRPGAGAAAGAASIRSARCAPAAGRRRAAACATC